MADDEERTSAVRVTLRDIWEKQGEMAETLQAVAAAVAPLTQQVAGLQSEKLGVADYKYERDMRDHQAGEFRTEASSRIRELELWKAGRTGVSAAMTTVLYVAGGAGVAFVLNHLVK